MLNPKQMASKQYLQQIYRCNELIQENLAEIENLRAMSTSIASPDFAKEKVSKSQNTDAPFVNAVNKLVDLEKATDSKMAELLGLRMEIRETINLVEDAKQILILRYRYIDFMKWEDIAEKTGYSLKSAYRIHALALNAVADILATKEKLC
ncbi:MAG: DUF1492 domain-containing protein [Ruminococcus flavefaciens]|nr:DUF1492 domain-containing protein [Ruminococcus flavefaciens]